MRILDIKGKNHLNEFVGSRNHSEFTQSWQWGEFQEKAGCKVFRLGVEDDGKLVAAATMVKRPLLMGMGYLYCPRGPVMKREVMPKEREEWDLLLSAVKKLAKRERVIFIRLEPHFLLLTSHFLLQKTIDIQPPKTSVLDLFQSENDLLAAMHQKTRYNIRLAEKKGVKVRPGGTGEFERFWGLMAETYERDNFRLHPKKYYEAMLAVDGVKLYLAEYAGKIIAGGIMISYGDTTTYMHGASANEQRNVMAPYLLQWRAIMEAKADNRHYYDFYGIDEKRWPGVTRFKLGFGGQEEIFPGTYDLIFNRPAYHAYRLVRKIRRAM